MKEPYFDTKNLKIRLTPVKLTKVFPKQQRHGQLSRTYKCNGVICRIHIMLFNKYHE